MHYAQETARNNERAALAVQLTWSEVISTTRWRHFVHKEE